jgi:hypothetical protein
VTLSRAILILCTFAASHSLAAAQDSIDFNRDIRPLLSDRCLTCHGPDDSTREADLRLDEPARLGNASDSVVAPGSAENSTLFERITSTDPDIQMPPPESEKSLSKQEIELIRQWINQGAVWDDHWSWVPPVRPAAELIEGTRSPIDAFIRRRLKEAGLSGSQQADRVTLIRRLSFDLTGLPPEWDDVQNFVNDDSPDAYEKVVDRLLESPHFGERMAVYWLDVVRYADSNGYHSDEPRQSAPYRDYVIDAFNSNKPYDQFVIEQLAGDLLPNATTEQHVASGFNMLLQTTSEGGAQPKEYIAKYAADRVRNTSQIFLGSTLGCAECHNHKFDPFTSRDFYQFAAFFADIEQPAVGNPPPHPVIWPEDQQKLDSFDAKIRSLRSALAQADSQELQAAQAKWIAETQSLLKAAPQPSAWQQIGPFVHASFSEAWDAADVAPDQIALAEPVGEQSWTSDISYDDGKVHNLPAAENANVYLYRTITSQVEAPVTLSFGSDDGIQVWLNGDQVHANRTQRGPAADQDQVAVNLNAGTNTLLVRITNGAAGCGFYFRLLKADLPEPVVAVLQRPTAEWTPEQQQLVSDEFRQRTPLLQPQRDALSAAEAERKSFADGLPKTLMTKTSQPKVVRLLNRGDWMDESGPVVQPAVPEFLGTLEATDGRLNRLDLARWIVAPDNPLTARVMVNRLWKLFFARGLATPLDDFGRQGVLPSHPQLLDWLACEFRDSGYDVKRLVRLMVTSDTYRQTANPTPQQLQLDPANRLFARQSRFRLDAEFVRDNALAISGLLVERIGGRSVYPYQPAGYWTHMNFPKRTWPGDSGDRLYRRGVYTWWQRMFLHPSLKAFDAPSREECTVERPRSNIPQQALVLLNDPTYVEAARAFAVRMLKEAPDENAQRINWAFQVAVSRDATSREISVLQNVLTASQQQYLAEPAAAASLMSVGKSAPADDLAASDIAAWTSVARVIMNLSETITRP